MHASLFFYKTLIIIQNTNNKKFPYIEKRLMVNIKPNRLSIQILGYSYLASIVLPYKMSHCSLYKYIPHGFSSILPACTY